MKKDIRGFLTNKVLLKFVNKMSDKTYLKLRYYILMGHKLRLTPPFYLQRSCNGLSYIIVTLCTRHL